jgi:putative oxidoreductase
MEPKMQAAEPTQHPWPPRLAAWLLAAMWLWAGWLKWQDPNAFAIAIDNYRLLPPTLISVVALALPTFELVLGVALLAGPLQRGAALLTAGLLLMFTAGMAQAKLRGIDLDCGCFGSATTAKVEWTSLLRNVVLASVAIYVVIVTRPARRAVQKSVTLSSSSP